MGATLKAILLARRFISVLSKRQSNSFTSTFMPVTRMGIWQEIVQTFHQLISVHHYPWETRVPANLGKVSQIKFT
jgi:hypothetical protein